MYLYQICDMVSIDTIHLCFHYCVMFNKTYVENCVSLMPLCAHQTKYIKNLCFAHEVVFVLIIKLISKGGRSANKFR